MIHFLLFTGSGGSNAARIASSKTFFNPFCKQSKVHIKQNIGETKYPRDNGKEKKHTLATQCNFVKVHLDMDTFILKLCINTVTRHVSEMFHNYIATAEILFQNNSAIALLNISASHSNLVNKIQSL